MSVLLKHTEEICLPKGHLARAAVFALRMRDNLALAHHEGCCQENAIAFGELKQILSLIDAQLLGSIQRLGDQYPDTLEHPGQRPCAAAFIGGRMVPVRLNADNKWEPRPEEPA